MLSPPVSTSALVSNDFGPAVPDDSNALINRQFLSKTEGESMLQRTSYRLGALNPYAPATEMALGIWESGNGQYLREGFGAAGNKGEADRE